MIVRVGGGFLHLEDFLQLYGQAELEKTRKKSPLRRTITK